METRLSLEELNNVAEIEIVYKKKSNCRISERPQIIRTQDSYDILMHYWNLDTIELFEECKVLYLNRGNRVIQLLELSKGGITGTVVDPRLVLAVAIKVAASAIVLAHNHPSGNLKPSRTDELLTEKMKYAAALHDIRIIDHLIVTREGYFSFGDEGLL